MDRRIRLGIPFGACDTGRMNVRSENGVPLSRSWESVVCGSIQPRLSREYPVGMGQP